MQVHEGVVWFCAIAGATFLLGGLRLALSHSHETVRVAGIGWPKGIIEPGEFMRAVEPTIEPEECERLNRHFRTIQNSFLERTAREAKAGAKIVVWPEANLIVVEDEETAFLERARALARVHHIYLLMGMATLYPGKARTFRNHAVLLNSDGEIVYDYTELKPVPGFEKRYGVVGHQLLPVVDSEYGRIGTAICFDMDFAEVVRLLGRQRVVIALVPASDWKEIMPLHQQMAEFRAVENGVALFRVTRWVAPVLLTLTEESWQRWTTSRQQIM